MRRFALALVACLAGSSVAAACGEPYEGDIPTPAPDRDSATTEADGGDGGTTLDDAAVDAGDAGPTVDPCDRDQDGFRAAACDAGAGDCDDEDNRIHPEAGFRAEVPMTRGGDWNCDGTVLKKHPIMQTCPTLGSTCATRQGFVGDPPCGTSATYIFCKGDIAGCAIDDVKTQQRTQECQ